MSTIDLDLETLRSSGLLWKINHDLLHPLGLALAVGYEGSPWGPGTLGLNVAPSGTWECTDDINRDMDATFNAWYAANVIQPLLSAKETT